MDALETSWDVFTSKLVCRLNGCVKTTFDRPDDLVRQLKLRALRDGRKLKDAAADLLRAGLAAQSTGKTDAPAEIINDKKTGLPVIQCRRLAAGGQELSPDRVAQILSEQECGWAHDSG